MKDREANPFRLKRIEQMPEEAIIRTYCEPLKATGLFVKENTVFQGPRGSGKSTILRRICRGPSAETVDSLPDGSLVVGTYLTLGHAWVASFQDPAVINGSQYFTQALNLSAVSAFASSLSRLAQQRGGLGDDLAVSWASYLSKCIYRSDEPRSIGVSQLQELCDSLLRDLRDAFFRTAFGEKANPPEKLIISAPFQPITDFVSFFPQTSSSRVSWFFAIDELDNLSEQQQRVVNTIVRNSQESYTLKIGCLPYGHKTHETLTEGNPLRVGDDFEYVALWGNPKDSECRDFARRLYQSRARLADDGTLPIEPADWLVSRSLTVRAASLRGFETSRDWDRYASESVGWQPELFGGETGSTGLREHLRQYHPALAMSVLRDQERGNRRAPLYAGWEETVDASDGNPRRLLRLLDRMYESARSAGPHLGELDQSEVIRSAAGGAFEKLRALPYYGTDIARMVESLGTMLSLRLDTSGRPTKDSCSFEVDLAALSERSLAAFRMGVDFGAFFPRQFDQRDGYPTGKHVFWLSFGLAAKYRLLLRAGEAISSRAFSEAIAVRMQGQLFSEKL